MTVMNDSAENLRLGRLVVLDGRFAGVIYALSSDEILIGRNPTTDITLLDDGISREHAIICYEEGAVEYVIEDLQSSNGTKVNGKRIRSVTLRPNDEICIGNTSFRFEIDSPS
jgi:pSer/pThr/pTyr-binding forkhead associated (FHA) protein